MVFSWLVQARGSAAVSVDSMPLRPCAEKDTGLINRGTFRSSSQEMTAVGQSQMRSATVGALSRHRMSKAW